MNAVAVRSWNLRTPTGKDILLKPVQTTIVPSVFRDLEHCRYLGAGCEFTKVVS